MHLRVMHRHRPVPAHPVPEAHSVISGAPRPGAAIGPAVPPPPQSAGAPHRPPATFPEPAATIPTTDPVASPGNAHRPPGSSWVLGRLRVGGNRIEAEVLPAVCWSLGPSYRRPMISGTFLFLLLVLLVLLVLFRPSNDNILAIPGPTICVVQWPKSPESLLRGCQHSDTPDLGPPPEIRTRHVRRR